MIRIADIHDLPQIVAIYNAAIPGRMATADTNPITTDSRLEWFNQHKDHRPLWVMEKNNELAGWCSLQNFYGRPAYMGTAEISVYVNPLYQRQGIAREMMDYLLNEIKMLQISTLLAFIFAHNEPSIRFFKKYHFEQWGLLPRVAQLDGIERDVVIYGLHIP
ncbi:MAG: N-acetyltransferase [Proteobacteria bacterium]|nr:N-acetyltransferase [Pseudomonadota bacterium]